MGTNVSLTPELEAYARKKVEQGFYSSVSEVVRDALRVHQKQDAEYIAYVRARLAEAEKDIDEGNVFPYDIDEIIAQADAELEAENAK